MGLIPDKSKLVFPYHRLNQTFVWRSRFIEGYKIGPAYLEQPLDLSNYLLIRTRERLLLENKVQFPQTVLKGGKENRWTK